MKTRILIIDKVLIAIAVIAITGLIFFYYWNIASPNGEYGTKNFDPFYEYNTNSGIILIQTINLISWIGISIIGIFWIIKHEIKYKLIYCIFALCFIIVCNRWIELWYGSTFYYGEVRDKQGIYFPWFGLLLLTYITWRYHSEIKNKKVFIIKSILTIIIVLILVSLYLMTYEPWNLGQS